MLGINLIGLGMVFYGAKEIYNMNPKRKFKKIVESSFRTHELCNKEKHIKIENLREKEYGYSCFISLPSGLTVEYFRKYLPALEQDTSSKIRFKHIIGRKCSLDFGTRKLGEKITYSDDLPKKGLTVPFYSHFGIKTIDFWEESCWHFLIAGATGMGKSVLLRYILTHLLLSTKGNIQMHICSNKITDFHMYRGVPQFSLAKTIDDLMDTLYGVIEEAKRREKILASHNALDVRELREKVLVDLPPIFLVIDEYGRISDVEEVQMTVQEIIETYRYVDVHVIISTQRPDATSAIKPRIRANILGSMALSVRDEANSRMIVGTGEAAIKNLGGMAGRAVLLDGITSIVQVPYLPESKIKELLKSYEQKGHSNRGISKEIPSIIEGPTGEIMFSEKQRPKSGRKQGHEKTSFRRKGTGYPSAKRQVLPVYAEPDYDSPEQHQD